MKDLEGLQILSDDGARVLCRGWGSPRVASMRLAVLPTGKYPSSASLERLSHEYGLRGELDSDWAVRPIDLVSASDGTVLLLEDPGGQPLDRVLGVPMETGRLLRLAIGIVAALGKAHRCGLVHKDVKPANILVNSDNEVRLMGFGLASRNARERQAPEPPEFISGTLAYMAPEQTGRMNRSIDSRSDLYSLGVTLYQMVTGSLPFMATDPMEWVHCHIARKPVPPSERLEHVPTPVSAIIMRLLSKTAEDRYQTADGVERDLRRCLAAWETERRIEDFPLGERDTSGRLLVPEKLYGRSHEVETLYKAFERMVKSGTPELVLVSGYSGIGKSSVVNELHKALVPPRGLFASGKFDQYKRDIPYWTLTQAFQSLTRRLLAKSDAELAVWREALLEALGANGQLMTEVVPELALIIGEQPPVPELPPQDARLRFQLVFRRFIGVFARREHPLVIFLDDLQWLDVGTLNILEDLLIQTDVKHLLLIGAYRDNEVDSTHSLMRTLESIRGARAGMAEIKLAPLAPEYFRQLIADTLRCEQEQAAPLARLIYGKTGGNPFFAIQFMTSLADEGMLAFDHDLARWFWDLERIHAKGYTDNVADLMVGKLTRLPRSTQSALQELACLGNRAAVNTLALLHRTSEAQIQSDLGEAVRLELIDHLDGTYKFVHDRVEEAAYSLIPKASRPEAHLRIGRLLTTQTPPGKLEETIFEIVNHLNRGTALITEPDERERVAELNLIAGKRAKASAAYSSAVSYFSAGHELLAEQCWEERYELIFALEIQRAECELLTGAAAAEERLVAISNRARSLPDLAAVASLREIFHTMHNQFGKSIQVALDFLQRVDVHWPSHPNWQEVLGEYESMCARLEQRPIDQIAALPLMSDAAVGAMVEVLTEIVPAAYFTDMNLCCRVVCRIANLSLQYGNSNGSVYAYSLLGLLLRTQFGNHGAGYQFGKVALELAGRPELNRFRARAYFNFGYTVNPWTNHLRTGRTLLRQAFTAAEETGDLTFAAYSHYSLMTDLIASGDPLEQVQREGEIGLNFVSKSRFGLVVDIMTAHIRFVRTLRGLTPQFGTFNDAEFDEDRFERHLEADPELANPTCVYWIRKLQARYYAGDCAGALIAASKAEPLLWTSPSSFEPAEYHFYAALALAAKCDIASEDERRQHLETLAIHSRQIATWEKNCPANFVNRASLVDAETARVESRDLEAMRLYERAIQSSREHGFVQNEGLANELAARFYTARGLGEIGHFYRRRARQCYMRWGADGKVRQLDELFSHLRVAELVPDPPTIIGASVAHLDLASVIRMSQVIAGEIVLERLVETLLRTVIEHAGAERGLLILPQGGGLFIQAEAQTLGRAVTVCLREAPVSAQELPESILRYSVRTQENVILDDASALNPFSNDEYIREKRPRSVLCLPLLKRGVLVALLYMENNLGPNFFVQDRIVVLKVLASQAAISLDNSRLYRERQQAEKAARRSAAFQAEGQRLSHTGSWGWEALTENVTWSDEGFRILGLHPLEAKPSLKLFLERVHPDDRAIVQRTVESAFWHKRDFEQQFRIIRPDGSIRHLHEVGHAVLNEANELVEFIGSIMDITDRKRSEERVQTQKEAIRLALNALVERLDVNRFVGDVIRELIKHFHASSWELWLSDDPAKALHLHSSGNAGESLSAGTYRKVARPLEELRGIWQTTNVVRAPRIIQFAQEDSLPDEGWIKFLRARGIKTLMTVPLMLGEQNLGFIEMHFESPACFASEDLELAQTLANHATLALQLNRLTNRAEQLAVTEERNRLAREIHDTMAQAFAGIVLHSEALGPCLAVNKRLSRKALLRIQKLARAGLEEARRSVQALRPKALDDSNLSEALQQAANKLASGGGLSCHFRQKGEPRALRLEAQSELFRIAQEALTNVSKHSRAKSVWISLTFTTQQISLSIRDDGVGLVATASPKSKRTYGLASMSERAQRIGGQLQIKRPKNGGTSVHVRVPLAMNNQSLQF